MEIEVGVGEELKTVQLFAEHGGRIGLLQGNGTLFTRYMDTFRFWKINMEDGNQAAEVGFY